METEKRKKSTFSAISINRIVAGRFREYSKKITPSHTDTLESMMDFFEGAKISPKDKHLMDYIGYNNVITKRLDYLLEVLRAWEKNSPIHRIHDHVKKLFDYAELEENLDKKKEEIRRMRNAQYLKPKKTVSKYEYNLLAEQLEAEKEKRRNLLEKFKLVKPSFGKQYYRIDMTPNEYAVMKRVLREHS